jgi:hypothetical protein
MYISEALVEKLTLLRERKKSIIETKKYFENRYIYTCIYKRQKYRQNWKYI